MIILDDEHRHGMRTCADEVKARGAEVIIVTDNTKLAEGLAVNSDTPRNLAKAVTVD